tara:strand:- start:190 stop:600 length:411 start_codon:yes stop_codon:yes gene_type:complete
MSNKSIILKTFLKQFSEFLEDIVKIFPDDKEIITAKVYFEGLKKVNPRLLITSWKIIIADNYEEQILDGDFNFFIEKDYKEDIEEVAKRRNWDEDYSYINENIETLRSKIANESEYNKNISMKYLINLTKLSKLYI